MPTLYCAPTVRDAQTVVYWPHAMVCDLADAGRVSPREILRRIVRDNPLTWVIA